MDSKRLSRLIGYMVLGGIACVLVLLLPFITGRWFTNNISPQAQKVDDISLWMTVTMVVITAIVIGLVLYCVKHFTVRKGDLSDGIPLHGNHRMELVFIIVPTIIVSVITAFSYAIMTQNEKAQARTDMSIRVHGFQFGWNFDYPRFKAADLKDAKVVKASPNLVLPIGEEVDFLISSAKNDTLHSFWVPEARVKQDAVPGVIRDEQWKPDQLTKPGDIRKVVCAELCGGGHSGMLADYCVVSRADFVKWTQDGGTTTCVDLLKGKK